MSSDVIEPGIAPDVPGAEKPGHLPHPHHPERPIHHRPYAEPNPSSISSDELTASLTEVRPDPMLGSFDEAPAPALPDESPLAHLADAPRAGSDLSASRKPLSSDVMKTLASIGLGETTPEAASGEAFAALDFGANDPSPSPHPTQKGHSHSHTKPSPNVVDEVEEVDLDQDDEDGEAPRGTSWITLLLMSYASAVTLGLLWVLFTGRKVREDVVDSVQASDNRTDPGVRADRSRRIAIARPIPAGHLTTLGRPVTIGQIEVTPVSVEAGPVVLEREFQGKETKQGGDNALKLRLRIKNTSNDLVLAPFDEAFVRDRTNADPDSYVEGAVGDTKIALFPLALESEWSIRGQQFRELKPGEEMETDVVTVPDAVAKIGDDMTWRIRLRTDINHTDDLGVKTPRDSVKTKP